LEKDQYLVYRLPTKTTACASSALYAQAIESQGNGVNLCARRTKVENEQLCAT